VATLRDPLEIASPADLEIRHDAFGSCPATVSEETGQWIPPSENPVVQLRPGLIVRSGITGREYKVGGRLGVGGFGVVYRVTQVSGPAPLPGACVLKIASEPRGWHREAYFGELLRGASGVVQVHESFAWAPRGKGRKPLYCLVSELVEGGDLAHHLERSPEPWPERKARREIIRLLRAVTLLHSAGAVHRDITPLNVFVTADGFLKLGDFGIAQNRIGKRDVPADFFNRRFAPETMIGGKTRGWRPADDIYQLGQLYALLLGGCGKAKLSAQDVKKLSCSPEAKAVIQRCIGLRRKRFASATEMLVRLEKQEAHAPAWASPRSLEGKSVVFTGRLSIGRDAAKRLLINAGGIFEKNVGQRTDFVVVGEPSPHWKGEKEGQKLLDVDHEEEVGHDIALIKGSRFLALVRPVRKSTAH
jgi:serine/threonine-protein kinase